MRKVVVSGYFNPVHKGHLDMIHAAKRLGDYLIVIVNNDEQVKIKGSTPFMDEQERLAIVKALRGVDAAILSVDKDAAVCETLKMLNPDVFANGGDRKNTNDIPEAQVCNDLNIEMVFGVGGSKTQSSSTLLNNVK